MKIENKSDESSLGETAGANLIQRSLKALIWNYIGTAISIASQFVVGIILARVLGPDAFGVVAIGMLVISFGNLIVDFGFSSALIQADKVTPRDVGFVFFVHISLGLLFSLAGYFSAGGISNFFHRPDAQPIIAAMSLLFTIQACGQTASAVLRRYLNFKGFQSINIVSYLVGYMAVGIPCALNGYGAWSLVFAQLVQSCLFSTLAIWKSRLRMRFYLHPDNTGLFAFGGKVIFTNLCNSGISNLDSVLVGRFLGVNNLGLYNRAMVLISTPINTITGTLQGVLFAACSRAQAEVNQVKRSYVAASAVIGLIVLPICLTVAAIPSTVILAVYGDEWAGAIQLIRPLALAIAVNALLSVIGPILSARNRVTLELRAQLGTLLVMAPLVWFSAQYSVEMVAWAVFAVGLLRWALLLWSLSANLAVNIKALLAPIRWPAICGVTTASCVYLMDQLLTELTPFVRMSADGVTGIFCLGILFLIFRRQIMNGPHGDYLASSGRLPEKFKRWMRPHYE